MKKLWFLLLLLPLPAQAVEPISLYEWNIALSVMQRMDMKFYPDPVTGALYFGTHYRIGNLYYSISYCGRLGAWDFTPFLTRRFTLWELYMQMNFVEGQGC